MTTPATASSLREAPSPEALTRARRRLLTAHPDPTRANTPTPGSLTDEQLRFLAAHDWAPPRIAALDTNTLTTADPITRALLAESVRETLERRLATERPYGTYDNTRAGHDAFSRVSCPGYCGECLRPDWRFGMSGQRKYSMELRERATRMALEARADPSRRRGAIKRIGGQLGINPEALRTWVRAVEQGGRNERGEISDQEARIRALEAENRELRRANEILKAASAFFGAELDRLGR